jgi:chromate reductase, NAD(P)H dehydrogenase (quinone)
MAGQKNALVICGSLRQGSFNRAIANSLPELAPAGLKILEAPDISAIPHYNADVQNDDGFPPSVTALADAVRAADGVIFVSPEYNFSVPGVLKNAIDWVSRVPNQPFKNKPVAIQSGAIGMLGGARMQYHLRQILVFLEAIAFTKPEVFVSFARDKVDAQTHTLTDQAARKVIASQLEEFETFITRLS